MNATTKTARRPGMLAVLALCACLLAAALGAAPAQAEFGLSKFDAITTDEAGAASLQAGSHPFAYTTSFEINSHKVGFESAPDGEIKDLVAQLPPGLIGDGSYPTCSTADFSNDIQPGGILQPGCPASTAVGVAAAYLFGPPPLANAPAGVFDLAPPPGVVARLGFIVVNEPIIMDIRVKQGGGYNVVAAMRNTSQAVVVFGGMLQLWGVPADPAHDNVRGSTCFGGSLWPGLPDFGPTSKQSRGSCPAGIAERPFLTLPTSCDGPVATDWAATSWQDPGPYLPNGDPDLSSPSWVSGSVLSHDLSEPPVPQGFHGCGKLGYAPEIESAPTSDQAETGTGLDFNVDFNDEGLGNPHGLAQSTTKKVEVTLPEGMTINPSIGEGLGVCTPADIARESLELKPGQGCPNSSKVGSLFLKTPLVEEAIEGSVYLAEEDNPETTEPGAENPFDSLIALYLVLRNPTLGALVKLPMKVEPDPSTGRLVATLEDIPQFPFSHFNFHFKEGVRAALVTPATCGTYSTEAKFYPWSEPGNPHTLTSSFEITQGTHAGSCPPGGVPPFNPRFQAGSENNNAASFSPFDMRLIREDGEQDMTKFSATLPPGELGSLAGVSKCPDSAIAAARAKTGMQELASPSCPANSLIGHTLAGAGVGSALTYVKGYTYLGGPYHGDPLSVIAITPAVAGPFDAGTVVVQEALTLNPKTAEVEVDGANSDPIPHIVKGIVLKLRDLRVNVDRPNFTLNPTSCDESSAKSVLFGSYLNVLDPSDDRPVDLSTRYQAANCLNLGFKPDLKLKLKGGTKRGGHPGLKAIYTPRKGDANIKGLVVRLPRSAFLDQAHIKTICTRVQFAAGGGNGEQCPAASRYGYVKAWTPLLDEPLQGPVYLRSSNHKLPDMVLALHGLVNIEADIRIDSAHGGIRATLEDAPDATLSRVILRMQGAKKGLIINSRNLCAHPSRANDIATAQSGKQFHTHPVMQAQCGKAHKKKHRRHHRRARVARSGSPGR